MLSLREIAKLKADIEWLETTSQACNDSGIKKRIEELIEELKQRLATEKKGPSERR
jgi:hypothetical protein